MARFTLPRDIYHGANAIDELAVLKGHRHAFLVTGGSSMRKGGFLGQTQQVLEHAGLQVTLFEGVENDPTLETVLRGAKAMESAQPDVIIALGGGSPMDAAKAMWIFYEHPDVSFDAIKKPFSLPPLRKKAIFVAIPSTSGSASEVTAFSVITDEKTQIKYPLADFEITPDIAVLDTNLPQTMPQQLTAHTGMDALTHGVEAYVASGHSDFSDPLARQAVDTVFSDLPLSFDGNQDARSRMHIAQCLAGMAFSNALLGISHSLAHKTGAVFGLSHGCCNAILLPYVIQYNAPACVERYAQLARMLHLPGETDRQLTASLVAAIKGLNARLAIPQSYRENGITPQLFDEHADWIAKNAVDDPCTASNPRPIDVATIKKVLTCAFIGEDVSF